MLIGARGWARVSQRSCQSTPERELRSGLGRGELEECPASASDQHIWVVPATRPRILSKADAAQKAAPPCVRKSVHTVENTHLKSRENFGTPTSTRYRWQYLVTAERYTPNQSITSRLMRHMLPRLAPTGPYHLRHPHSEKRMGRPVALRASRMVLYSFMAPFSRDRSKQLSSLTKSGCLGFRDSDF